MNSQTYNQVVLELAIAGLADLTASAQTKKAQRTPAQESHFLCNWMVESLKEKRFSKLVADDLTAWIRLARSQGAGAELKHLLERIVYQYQAIEQTEPALGIGLNAMLEELKQAQWLVFTDTDITAKLKLDGDGQSSLVIDAKEFSQHIKDNQLVKPINLYVRADEQQLTRIALSHGLLLSQSNKKTSLIKHHKTYRIYPHNQQPALCQLLA
ncbi:DUF2913 family protein [Shewanella glacialipiscicola]|uniref:DUF2913 domain-containing protein n=1 Tax=Shewanella glacialipiscicola TaxID=614069 RepID=A0ABQ6J1V5_9GAMM|nr:DUF2913 family protein [Shewanella glacialipiscicola]MCL1086582.1 DUF2913 family protein [Shewanella glacialipiscicola]MCU7993950.1 DUF2913 family protein [Shewanella glacialipiscicola]MCU8025268.1 DUF2913 family protein [Shewanella glacialipiscicola]GIU05319.1 DUF2913 domain-containing protein [Shewanella glacialipiscicola]GMA81214.1 DUF2913 domain-containing protein [Shewanella glacialipiscicola]